MPRKTKRARMAEAQRASGTKFFGNGFSDDINEYVLDPTYEPTHDDEEIDGPNEGWAFSMFEGEVAEAADGESSESEDEWEEVEMVGEKRKASGIFNDSDVEELIDLEEEASLEAATKSEQLWKEFFEQVCDYNIKKLPFK
jgi:hypothetical protein